MPRKADSIPGGGAGGAYSGKSRGGGGYKRAKARAYGESILDNEGGISMKRGPRRSVVGKPAPANGTRSINTQAWVQGKIAEGDIAGGMSGGQSGTSIFDPVLCELAYRWFSPPGGVILDPFAGGSVRGIVASFLGRRYTGIDLSERQIEANRAQAAAICGEPRPIWICGDAQNAGTLAAGLEADFIFTCPPYGDLERYSDDPQDLSTMDYKDFRLRYAAAIAAACSRLKPDSFACICVGDFRDKRGAYRNFPGHTVEAFQAAGLDYYNEAILLTQAGSLPIRAAKQFEASRKLGKTHQNVLVFCKGDARKATAAVGPIEFGEIEEPAAAAAS